jgi:hypothetical protein
MSQPEQFDVLVLGLLANLPYSTLRDVVNV